MAREAASSGDRVAAENFYQHAEHYFRVMNAAGEGQQHGQGRPMTPADTEMNGGEMGGGDGESREGEESQGQAQVQLHTPMPPQPAIPSEPGDEQPSY